MARAYPSYARRHTQRHRSTPATRRGRRLLEPVAPINAPTRMLISRAGAT